MNTPPHSESGPSCSGSVSSLKDLAMTTSVKGIAHPPTPPFDSQDLNAPVQPTFFFDEAQLAERFQNHHHHEQHECCTVLEEDEDADESGSIESSAAMSASIASSSEYGSSVAPTTAAENSTEKPPSKRRSSSRITGLFKRSSPPNGTVSGEEPAPVTLPGALRSTRSFFTSRSQRTPSFNAARPSLDTTPPVIGPIETNGKDVPAGPQTGTSQTFGSFSGRLGRNRRSASMTGIANLTSSNQITHPAPTGLGLKSKKISRSGPLPEVEAFPLSKKYTTHSSVPLKSKQIGEGATAVVKLYKEINGSSGMVFAVKEFRKKSSTEKEDEYIFKVKSEFLVSKSLHHPNIIETADLCIGSGKRWCHVMEYCPGGDLFSLIKKRFMKESEKLCCFKQLLRGVAYLHKQGIAHRDIKPENLLMSSDGHLKITDFGVSERFVSKEVVESNRPFDIKDLIRSSPGICGSEPYLPPEVLSKKGDYDSRKLDVWSCAVVYFTLAYGGTPWTHAKEDDPMFARYISAWNKWEVKHPDLEITNDCDLPSFRLYCEFKTGIKRLLYRMTHLNPDKRITIHEALDDRFIQGIECCTFDDEYSCKEKLDASHQTACKTANKMNVKRMHSHLPPKHL